MVLSGYARLRYCNNFIPTDIQAHLSKNIGKNNRVVVADYLIGDNAKHNPALPKHLNQKINQLNIKEKARFVQQCKNMLIKMVGQIISAFTGPAYGWRFPFIVVAIPALFCAFLLMIYELSPSLRVSTSVLEKSKNNDKKRNSKEM